VTAPNILLIMSDEHVRDALGCYGNSVVKTPNLDGLARRGTQFTNSYTASPICVPSRASLATGRYVHDLGTWDNATPYTGEQAASWGHRLVAAGHSVVTVGKLHYRSVEDDTGFSDQRLPMHVADGVGDLRHLIRGEHLAKERVPTKDHFRRFVVEAGIGESEYLAYDRQVTEAAIQWLRTSGSEGDRPWVLKVSYVSPHFPLLAPRQYFELYEDDEIPLPVAHDPEEWSAHPVLELQRRLQGLDLPVTDEQVRRAIRAYYGLVSFLDEQVGILLQTLEAEDLSSRTHVIYTSDHGNQLGNHGMWWKSSMYEGSVAVPFIAAGPGFTSGEVCHTNVSGVDLFPTILDLAGVDLDPEDMDVPGRSIREIANEPDSPRVVFSEFHSGNAPTGISMIRDDRYKYVHYVGYPSQLFDLQKDPEEMVDLASTEEGRRLAGDYRQLLTEICDPEAVDRQARSEQEARIAALGGTERIYEGRQIAWTPVATPEAREDT